jgi:DNA-directed RNA polymerase subunit RPC12/RpoP
MASKSSEGPGGVPWAVIIPVAHAAVDLATNAHCPDCGNQVVLYVCFNCNKPVWPDRGPAEA